MSRSSALGTEQEVRLAAGPIRYRERGDGESLVFVHGVISNADLWRELVPRLADRYRCIAPDWPLGSHSAPMDGSADLSPPGLAALIDEFMAEVGLDRVTLVGNDSGGALSQIVAARHPRRLARLVLTDCDAFDNFFPPMFQPLKAAAFVPGLALVVAHAMRLKALRNLPNAYGWLSKRPLPDDLAASFIDPLVTSAGVRRDAQRVLRSTSAKHTLDAAVRLIDFDRPALIAWGDDDRFFPWEHAERLAAILPDSRLERIEESRTYVPLDQPARLAQLIEEFVAAS